MRLMKKLILLSILLTSMPFSMLAQVDDMYFVPTKKNVAKSKESYGMPHDTYYSGSHRSVDDYNRRYQGGSSYQVISGDSTMQDVITFSPVEGVYPDSTAVGTDDFQLTKKMTRWDGYTPTDAYWEGYDRGRSDEWSSNLWHSPWYYSSYYPWYDPWYYDRWYYDPWYYSSWHYGWYDPWYYRPYRYYSWGWGGYYGGHYRHSYYDGGYYAGRLHHSGNASYYRPSTGTQSHGYVINSGRREGSSGIGAGRGSSRGYRSAGAGRSSVGSSISSGSYTNRSSIGSVGSSRSSSGSIGASRSSSSSIGAGRSSGGYSGGSRSGGGGGSRSAGRR